MALSSRRGIALLLGSTLFTTAPLTLAQKGSPTKPTSTKTAPSGSTATTDKAGSVHTSAIAHIATQVAAAIGPVRPGTLVAVSPLNSDVPAPKGDELALRLATQIAGRLGAARAHPQPVSLTLARGVSSRAASLVYVELEIARGELRATADLYPVVSNGWDRLRSPPPGPNAHAFVGAPIDAEIGTFLKPIVLEQASVHKAKHEETDVLAVGCGDVDSDGGLEIVVVTRTHVVVGKLRGGKLAVVRRAPFSSIGSRVPIPMREPMASVVVPFGHRSEILVGTTDRGAVSVDASLVTRRHLSGLPIAGSNGEACSPAIPESSALDGNGVACTLPTKGDPAIVLPALAPRIDAIAMLDLVGKDGSTALVVAAREPTGVVHLRRTDASGNDLDLSIDSAGAQIALADLDLDGIPEIAVSSESAENDLLTISSWTPNGLLPRLKLPANDGIRAIGACPPEEKGAPGLVAVVGGEVWLVR